MYKDYQNYDPEGTSIEDIVRKLQSQQKLIAATISDGEGNASKIEQNANNINLKVSKDSVISEINQTAETIKIQAEKLDLVGYVTVTDLSTEGSTEINGGNIKGGQLTLGGANNGNGRLIVEDENGKVIADLNGKIGGFTDLSVQNLTSPSVLNYNDKNYSYTTSNSINGILSDARNLNGGTFTTTLTGNISENVVIENFIGSGTVRVDLNGYKIDGWMLIRGCAGQFIEIKNGTINSANTGNSIYIDRSTFVKVDNCAIYGNNSTSRGVYITSGSGAYILNTEIYEVINCIETRYATHATVYNCKGLGSSHGLVSGYGGYIGGSGTTPGGSDTDYNDYSGEIYSKNMTIDYGAATPPAPPETTETFTNTSSKSWRDNWGWRTDNSDIYQGEWNGYGHHRGFAYFGTNISGTVTGKTIKKIRVYAQRQSSGGYSASVNAYFGWHSDASQPSGTPNIPSERVAVGYKWGEGKWFDAPSSWYADFEAGTAKGIGIYTSSTGNDDYMIFEPTIKVEITYA